MNALALLLEETTFQEVLIYQSGDIVRTTMELHGFSPKGEPRYILSNDGKNAYHVQPYERDTDATDIVYKEVPEGAPLSSLGYLL